MLPIYINSDTIVRLDELQNPTDDSYVDAATVTFTLKDFAGAEVSGAVAISMTYVPGSNGRYEGLIAETVSLGLPGTEYDLEVTIESARTDFRKIRCVSQYRGVR